jgi:hypothetical protein
MGVLLQGLFGKLICELVAQGHLVLGRVFVQVPESLMGFDLVGGDEAPPRIVDCPSKDPTVNGLVAEVRFVSDPSSQEATSIVHIGFGRAQGLLRKGSQGHKLRARGGLRQ